MTKKAEFNAEEWSLLLEGPPTAGMIVISAQRGGTLRESISMARAYEEARHQEATELVDEIAASGPEFRPQRYSSAEELKQLGLQRLKEAVQMLEQKATPEEVESYKGFVLDLAERAAKAHREGGFLGVGGKEISESEQAALDEVAAALGSAR
jgi:hypothetical protein